VAAEEQIYTALGALVSNRCYPVKAPQASTLPYIVYEKTAGDRIVTLNRSTVLANHFFSINCYASTVDAARTLAASVKTAMESAGVVNELQSESNEYDPDTDLDFIALSYSCWESE